MNHSFNIHHARDFGLHEAILINNLQFWIAKNRANGTHFHDGRTWTYNSVKAFAELFPYMTTNIVRRTLESLQEQSVIIKGNYNSSSYDRTAWFAFFDESIWLSEPVHLAKKPNGKGRKATSLTDINTDITADVNTVGERTHSQANATTTPAPVPANDFEPVPAQAQSPAKPTQAQAHSYPSQPAPTAPSAPQKPVKAPKPACSAATPEIDIPADLLADFLVVRKSKRAGPLTNTAIAGLKREAAKAGISLEAAVTACCEYGWQGFNATWYADRTTTATAPARRASSPRTPAPENFADRVYVGGRL